MSADIDDFLGAPPANGDREAKREARRKAAEEKLIEEQRRKAIKEAGAGITAINVRDFKMPVSQNFLAQVFNMTPETVKKRLLRCPTDGMAGGGRPVYDFKTACGYLVKPQMTNEEFIRTLNAAQLPPEINLAFWNAQRARLRYLHEAADAWATEDVLEVFGDVFMTIKDRMQLFIENMRSGMTDEQSNRMSEIVEAFQADLHAALVEMPLKKRTEAIIAKKLEGAGDRSVEIAD